MSGSRISAMAVAWDRLYPPSACSAATKFCRKVLPVLVTVERCRSGGVMLNRSLSAPWLNTVLMAGRPIWSSWASVRKLQHDAEDVLVDEEVAVFAAGDERFLTEGHRRALDDHFVGLAVVPAVTSGLPLCADHRRELLS